MFRPCSWAQGEREQETVTLSDAPNRLTVVLRNIRVVHRT